MFCSQVVQSTRRKSTRQDIILEVTRTFYPKDPEVYINRVNTGVAYGPDGPLRKM